MRNEEEEKRPINEFLNNSDLDAIILENNLAKIAYTLDKDYLAHLDDYGVFKFKKYCELRNIEYKENETKNFMAIKVTNFIINKDEKVIDCMKNVIGSFSNSSDCLAFLVHRKVDSVDIYFIFKKDGEVRRDVVANKLNLLEKSFKGNFPGSATESFINDKLVNDEFSFFSDSTHISVLSSVPSDKSEDYISQGIEKLLNGVVPAKEDEEYTVMILAESLTQEAIREIINGFEEMATSITPYAGHQFQAGKNDAESTGEMKSSTDTTGVSHAISKTHSINIGANVGRSLGTSSGTNSSIADMVSETEGSSEGSSITESTNESETDSTSEAIGNNETDTTGEAIGNSINAGVNSSVNASVTTGTSSSITAGGGIPGVAHAEGTIGGHIDTTIGGSVGTSLNTGHSTTTNTAKAIGKSITNTVGKSITKGVGRAVGTTIAKTAAKTIGKTVTSGVFSSISKMLSVGLSGGYGYSWGKIDTDSESKSLTDGTNHNITVGTSENTTYNYKSYQVADLLQTLEAVIKRLTESKSTGLWKVATYVFSKDGNTSRSVANYLRGLTQGDESYIESASVFDWEEKRDDNGNIIKTTPFPELKEYLTHFTHPIFINKLDVRYNSFNEELWKPSMESPEFLKGVEEEIKNITGGKTVEDLDSILEVIKNNKPTENIYEQLEKFFEKENNKSLTDEKKLAIVQAINNLIEGIKVNKTDLIPITPTTNISTTELAKIFSLPTHSLPGLPVLECAEFGRNVSGYDDSVSGEEITIGKIYHMHNEESLETKLKTKSLTSHTFITGSTGSGKSNTSYVLLNELINRGKKFLVIEPAKGEYKNVFGMDDNVSVYGTNPQKMPLLRINPFSFPKDIHILEHLDRLIEIFNVCWPMYAAMPAVLKEAIEKSYEDAGWDLTESTNEYGENLYPTFADVTRNIRTIIDSSEYDAENKGAYKGSLITRLKSLSNGINGLIFGTDEISNKDLFDSNVIIDLSRVGSNETKSLIMGLLVLKLQEYRMTQGKMNAELEHITVLEEAHNLLRRTSENSSDSGNLRSKSVEMLTNAIAEMRTYGEGFIIADQAPGLLDMAVIRNTNTKIIMRLPDLGDRELVGKAANLSDNQIEELAKLPCGVAAVYQNEWVQPVLCKISKANSEETKYKFDSLLETKNTMKERIKIAKLLFATPVEKNVLEELRNKKFKFSGSVYVTARKYVESTKKKPNFDNLAQIVSEILPEFAKTLIDSVIRNPGENIKVWRDAVMEHIEQVLKDVNESENMGLRNHILQCVLQNYVCNEIRKPQLLNELRGGAK